MPIFLTRNALIAMTSIILYHCVMGANLTPFLSLSYKHAFGNTLQTKHVRMNNAIDMDIAGVPLAQDVGVVETGLKYQVSQSINLSANYRGQFGSRYNNNYFSLNASMKF